MAQSHILAGLVSKRSELVGRIEALNQELKKLTANVETLDSSIKIFDPDYDLRSIRPKKTRSKNQFFSVHGDASRFVLDTLRKTTEPLNTNQIADLAASERGLINPDMKALRACILTTLSRQRINGVVVEVSRDESGTIKWKLADKY